jgi:hypothetical protein
MFRYNFKNFGFSFSINNVNINIISNTGRKKYRTQRQRE